MTNSEIVESYYNLHILKMDKEYYEEKLAYYQKGLDDINKFISAGERVDEIYDGIPIGKLQTSYDNYDMYRFDNNKRITIYRIADSLTLFSLILKFNDDERFIRESKSINELNDLAIKYLTSNSSPAEFLYDYERGKL